MPCSGSQGLIEFFPSADFDLDRCFRSQPRLPNPLESRSNTTRGRDVIVLDQDSVEEAESMVCHASGARCKLFESPQPGRGLACIQHLALGSGDCIDILTRKGRDAGKPLDEVEADALAFEQCLGAAAN